MQNTSDILRLVKYGDLGSDLDIGEWEVHHKRDEVSRPLYYNCIMSYGNCNMADRISVMFVMEYPIRRDLNQALSVLGAVGCLHHFLLLAQVPTLWST